MIDISLGWPWSILVSSGVIRFIRDKSILGMHYVAHAWANPTCMLDEYFLRSKFAASTEALSPTGVQCSTIAILNLEIHSVNLAQSVVLKIPILGCPPSTYSTE